MITWGPQVGEDDAVGQAGNLKLRAALSEYSNGRTSIPQLTEPRPRARHASLDEQGVSFNIATEVAARAV